MLAAQRASWFIEIPIAFDAITVVIHPQNDWVKSLSTADLKKIWEPAAQATILRWTQVRPEWPDVPLMLFGPGADSGTFDYFTEAVVGKAKSSRGDFTASEDDNVLVQGVENNKNSLGYFGLAYYVSHQERMRAVPIVNSKGAAILPSIASVTDGSYEPLSRPLFILCECRSGGASRSAPVHRVLLDRRAGARSRSRLRAAARQSIAARAQAFSGRQARLRVRWHSRGRRDYRGIAGARGQALKSTEV